MTRRYALALLVAAIGAPIARSFAAPPPAVLTATERDAALKYLKEMRDLLLGHVAGLSAAQWTFKPAPEVWSAAEILEHVTVVEEAQIKVITSAASRLPALPADDRPQVKDQVIEMVTTNRETRRFQTPEVFKPTGRWNDPKALVEAFGIQRAALIDYTTTTTDDLRSVAWENPLVGLSDGYQWILFVAAHGERHTKQLVELKAHPRFPRS